MNREQVLNMYMEWRHNNMDHNSWQYYYEANLCDDDINDFNEHDHYLDRLGI